MTTCVQLSSTTGLSVHRLCVLWNSSWIMWPCYGVHITSTVCMHGTSCFCTMSVSPFMHWAIPTWARFLLEIFFKETCFCSFLIKKSFNNLLRCSAYLIAVNAFALSTHMCWQMASNSQYALPHQSSPQESASSKSHIRSKQSSKGPSPDNFDTIGGVSNATTRISIRR